MERWAANTLRTLGIILTAGFVLLTSLFLLLLSLCAAGGGLSGIKHPEQVVPYSAAAVAVLGPGSGLSRGWPATSSAPQPWPSGFQPEFPLAYSCPRHPVPGALAFLPPFAFGPQSHLQPCLRPHRANRSKRGRLDLASFTTGPVPTPSRRTTACSSCSLLRPLSSALRDSHLCSSSGPIAARLPMLLRCPLFSFFSPCSTSA